jgi:hypothetical protein
MCDRGTCLLCEHVTCGTIVVSLQMFPFPSPPPNRETKAVLRYHYLALCVVSGDVAIIRTGDDLGGWVIVYRGTCLHCAYGYTCCETEFLNNIFSRGFQA